MTLLRSLQFSRPSLSLLRKLPPCTRSLTGRTAHHAYEYQPSVDLEYTVQAPSIGTDGSLLILHGLFGSKRNWQSLCKALHRALPTRPIYALDLRNHGASPHAAPHTNESMAADVKRFIERYELDDVTLLGHSMGGKVAMTLALSSPTLLSRLIISDIAPTNKPLHPEFVSYISAMQHINSLAPGVIRTRADADRVLAQYEPDVSIRQFLLTNLVLPPHSSHTPNASTSGVHNKPRFALPLDLIEHSIPALGAFPWEYRVPVGREGHKLEHPIWDGPTLVVKGTKSPYITDENLPSFKAFFPNSRVEELDAGHWVHAEKPKEFLELVVEFLDGK